MAGRFFRHLPSVFCWCHLLTKPSNGRLESCDAGLTPSGAESQAEEWAASERATFKPMTTAGLSPCQEPGTCLCDQCQGAVWSWKGQL